MERRVRARLDEVDGHFVHATLLEDDPNAICPPKLAGESGTWHGLSFVETPIDAAGPGMAHVAHA